MKNYKLHFLYAYCDVDMKWDVCVRATDEINAICKAGDRFKGMFSSGEWENGKVIVQGVGFGHI